MKVAASVVLCMLGVANATFLRSFDNPAGDPYCKTGSVNGEMTVCCPKFCSTCSDYATCSAYPNVPSHCCPTEVAKVAKSCDDSHPPCMLSNKYRDHGFQYPEGDRTACADCTQALPNEVLRHESASAKGTAAGEMIVAAREVQALSDYVAEFAPASDYAKTAAGYAAEAVQIAGQAPKLLADDKATPKDLTDAKAKIDELKAKMETMTQGLVSGSLPVYKRTADFPAPGEHAAAPAAPAEPAPAEPAAPADDSAEHAGDESHDGHEHPVFYVIEEDN